MVKIFFHFKFRFHEEIKFIPRIRTIFWLNFFCTNLILHLSFFPYNFLSIVHRCIRSIIISQVSHEWYEFSNLFIFELKKKTKEKESFNYTSPFSFRRQRVISKYADNFVTVRSRREIRHAFQTFARQISHGFSHGVVHQKFRPCRNSSRTRSKLVSTETFQFQRIPN